jgi:hypothetical protein
MQGVAHLPASALEGGGFDAARDCGEGEEEEDWVGGSDWNTQALVQGAQTAELYSLTLHPLFPHLNPLFPHPTPSDPCPASSVIAPNREP